MLEILIATLLGVLAGIITGITPGIHINLVAVIIISLSSLLLSITDPLTIGAFIISMSILHTFMNAVPAIFLGAPEESTALAVLPGHRLLLEGRGYEAVKLTIIGSLMGLISVILILPILILIIPSLYSYISNYIPYILIFSSGYLIYKEKNSKYFALIAFLLSGVLGLCVLNLGLAQPLFPLLSGLFGTSTILLSLKDKVRIPEQKLVTRKIEKRVIAKSIGAGLFSSFICGLLPGIGSAQSAIIATSLSKKWTSRSFLILVGSIDTIVMFLSIVALYTIKKSRSGSIVAISKLIENFTLNHLILYVGIALISGGIATILTLAVAKFASKIMTKINYEKICWFIIIFIIILSIILSGFLGLFVLIVSTFVGMIAPLKGINRSHMMGCLIIPVILFFLL